MKTHVSTIKLLTAAMVAGFVGAAQGQSTIISDSFESYTPGANWLAWASGVTNDTVTIGATTGMGGSQGLTWQADFPSQWSGYIAAQDGFGAVSGNTDPNLNDYVLTFDLAVPTGIAVSDLQLNIGGWLNQWYSGAQSSTGAGSINTSSVGVGTGFQQFSVNLGAFTTANTGNFNPLDQTWQIQFQINGWQLAGGGPVTGEQMTIDNLQVQVVPEPTTLALAGLGAAGLLAIRRRKV